MAPLTVGECMSKQFVTFTPQMPVVEAATALVRNELLGGPVVDDQGALIGWISEQDCLGTVAQVMYYADRVATVAAIMRRDLLTVRDDLSLHDLAGQMQADKPKIYPVVNAAGKLVGVISRRIVLREMCAFISRR